MPAIIATDSCHSQQLIRACIGDNMQLMVANSKKDFAERLNKACDDATPPVLSGRGRRAELRRRVADAGVNLSGESVRKWLAGESIPSMDNVRFLAIALKCDTDWLLTGRKSKEQVQRVAAEPAAQKNSATIAAFSLDEQRLIEGFRAADSKDRELMLHLAVRALEDFEKRSEQI